MSISHQISSQQTSQELPYVCIWHFDLDKSFCNTMMFSDNSKVSMMGKGNVKICTKENSNKIISNVFFVLDLKTNLVSVAQLQENIYEILIKDRVYSVEDEKLGLIPLVRMTTNQMFSFYLHNTTSSCFLVRSKEVA